MLAFNAVGEAAIVVGDGVARVELDGLVVVLDGAVVLAFGEVAIPRLKSAMARLGSSLMAWS